MKTKLDHWLNMSLEKTQYLHHLEVEPKKICEEIYKMQQDHFWCLERKLLVELMVFEFAKDRYYNKKHDDCIPF